ncbi:MAG: DNA polymerase domain-containing protein [Methanobacteriota archaeon]
MDVPLAAHRAIVDGEQYLDVWTNGRRRTVKAPFLPYCYAKAALPRGAFRSHEEVTVRPLSKLAPERWNRYGFATVQGVSDASKLCGRLASAEDHVPFVERVLIDEPSYFRAFPNTDPLRILYVDIEQYTTGDGFPTARSPIISVATARSEGDATCHQIQRIEEGDERILRAFLTEVAAYDPDVIVGYNVLGYDLPMLLARMRAARIDPSPLARDGRAPVVAGDDTYVGGRLVYDVFESVKLDQTLHGIKDLRLKTVGEWMGLPALKIDVTDTSKLVGTPELAEYNRSDAILTRRLSKVYFQNFVELAEFYGAPLNVVLRAMSSFHTNILQGRVFATTTPRIVSDGRNDERFAEVYASAPDDRAFVGGIVEIYRRGLFRPIWKVDFGSMYPTIMVSLGVGADNTRLVGEERFGEFRAEAAGGVKRYSIPDDHRNVNHVDEVEGQSEMAKEIARLLDHRLVLKRQAKEATDPGERDRLKARQNVLKVILNSIYGVNASKFTRYGSLPVAIATVGVARKLIRFVESQLGDEKIETDTDGVYSAQPVNVDDLSAALETYMRTDMNADFHLRLDAEEYAAGWFHEQKNYLLLHTDGRLEKHGVAFKGSGLPAVFDRALERVGRALLAGEDPVPVATACLDLSSYELPDFVQRLRLGKDPTAYKSANALGAQLARQYAKAFGREAEEGVQIEYVKTKVGYEVATPEAFARLDRAYYREMVETVLQRLGIEAGTKRQKSLADWM